MVDEADSIDSIKERIERLRRERRAVILAHNYQPGQVQDIADFCGDSLDLSRRAAETEAEVIVFCGVHFMAETAALLSHQKTVLLPDPRAGCPMADMADAASLRARRASHPRALVVTYVNSTAEVKAESDICCTSANAARVVESLPPEREIIFVPDEHLGDFVQRKTGRKMHLWEGFCPTHRRIRLQDIESRRREFPGAEVMVHPECRREVVDAADLVLSTGGMIRHARESGAETIIVGTEIGILHRLRKENPRKNFVPASEQAICPNMKLTTLEKIAEALEHDRHRVRVPEEVAGRARLVLEKMLRVS